MGGEGGQLPTLADQLTLSQPEGADCAPYTHYCLPTQFQIASYAPESNVYGDFTHNMKYNFQAAPAFTGQPHNNIIDVVVYAFYVTLMSISTI